MTDFNSSSGEDVRPLPRSSAPASARDGAVYTDLTGQPFWRISGSWLELATTADLYTDEDVDDRVSALIQNGTGISWTYDDVANTFTPAVSLAPFTTTNLAEGSSLYYTDERVDDRVNALLTAGTNITLTYNDAANSLTIDASSGSSGALGSLDFAAPTAVSSATTLAWGTVYHASGSTAYALTLPTASGNSGSVLAVYVTRATTAVITIDGSAAETISGDADRKCVAGTWIFIISDGTNCQVLAEWGNSVLTEHKTAAGQSIAHDTVTLVDFGTAVEDTHGAVTTGGSWAFTAPHSGVYEVEMFVEFESNSTGFRQGRVYLNGAESQTVTRLANSGLATQCETSKILNLSKGDTVSGRVYQNSGVSLGLTTNDATNRFHVVKVAD